MLHRVLEPEPMDTPEEARDYDEMDHSAVNVRFVADFLAAHGPCRGGQILDVGTGPGQIPIALCRADARARVLAIDLSEAMLARARLHAQAAGLDERIRCAAMDAKHTLFAHGAFEGVISNSIVHHIPEPLAVLTEMARLVSPGGTLFVRDLARPGTRAELDQLIVLYAGSESAPARAMFEASLHAALTVEEIQALVARLGAPADTVAMTSDRHWTWSWRRE